MSGAHTGGGVWVGWSHLSAEIGANDRFERALLALRKAAAANDGIPERIGAAEKHRSDSFRIPRFVNRARPEAAA